MPLETQEIKRMDMQSFQKKIFEYLMGQLRGIGYIRGSIGKFDAKYKTIERIRDFLELALIEKAANDLNYSLKVSYTETKFGKLTYFLLSGKTTVADLLNIILGEINLLEYAKAKSKETEILSQNDLTLLEDICKRKKEGKRNKSIKRTSRIKINPPKLNTKSLDRDTPNEELKHQWWNDPDK